MDDINYMVTRSLPMLIGDMTEAGAGAQSLLKTPVGISLTTSHENSLELFQQLMRLLHSIRLLQMAVHHVIPACDRDLPFQLQLTRKLESLETPGRIDIGATLKSGALASQRAVHLDLVPSFNNAAARDIGETLFRVMNFCRATLRDTRTLPVGNPLLAELTIRLSRLMGQLNRVVLDRPYLRKNYRASRKAPRHTRRSNQHQRSIVNARRLSTYFETGMTSMAPGESITTEHSIAPGRLYEFWCFCELTMRLVETGRFRFIQRSLLRTGMDSPAFSFGQDHFVFFEHRMNYFRFDPDRRIVFREQYVPRGPSWVILRGPSVEDCIVIECCYRGQFRNEMFGPISLFVNDYNGRAGVAFCSEPPERDVLKRKCSKLHKYFREDRGGKCNKVAYVAHLCPRPENEEFNREILDRLIERLEFRSGESDV